MLTGKFTYYPPGQGFLDFQVPLSYFTCHICKTKTKKMTRAVQKYCKKCVKEVRKLEYQRKKKKNV